MTEQEINEQLDRVHEIATRIRDVLNDRDDVGEFISACFWSAAVLTVTRAGRGKEFKKKFRSWASRWFTSAQSAIEAGEVIQAAEEYRAQQAGEAS